MTIITDAMIRHYNDLVARAEAEVLQNVIAEQPKYDDAFKQRVLDAVSEDIVIEPGAGWVFWQWGEDHIHGFLNAASLRVIAGELDRRNKELFGD